MTVKPWVSVLRHRLVAEDVGEAAEGREVAHQVDHRVLDVARLEVGPVDDAVDPGPRT